MSKFPVAMPEIVSAVVEAEVRPAMLEVAVIAPPKKEVPET